MDASDVGRYGTLHFMKRLEPDVVVASYPIDEEEITLGRDPTCSIRLYYDSVSALHCKIIFQERKAFLVVLGTNGLFVDGCPVFPASSPSSGPVTVPLPNNSTIEIHKKRFQFCYPPKELRPILLSTPSRPQEQHLDERNKRRPLRMSMIQSAQVFSPRPSQDPRENLRILQTPIKTPFRGANRRQSSPLKRIAQVVDDDEDDEDEEEEIVLVESNHPKVFEEERDLVILEHVEVDETQPEESALGASAPPAQPQGAAQFPIPPSAQPPPQLQKTPRRRPGPRASLHRAVLIRSAQRAALRLEMEKEEEEQEVEEVEETIKGLEVIDDGEEPEAFEKQDDDEADQDMEEVDIRSGWRKSLDVVTGGLGWAFRSSSVPRDVRENGDEDEEEQDITEAHEDEVADNQSDEEEDEVAIQHHDFAPPEQVGPSDPKFDRPVTPPQTHADTPQRALGNFMTPQVQREVTRGRGPMRYSVGGFTSGGIHGPAITGSGGAGGPRRVRLLEPWKVQDIVVPLAEEDPSSGVDSEEQFSEPVGTPQPSSPYKRERLSEEERKAIQERRRSAVNAPDTFFGGQVPGSRRLSMFPPVSPVKESHQHTTPTTEMKKEEEADEDTQVLLARMKEMVEGVKRRQSTGPRLSVGVALSPKKPGAFSLFAPGADLESPRRVPTTSQMIELQEQQEQDISDKENEMQDDDGLFEEHDTPEEALPASRRNITAVHEETATPVLEGVRNMFVHQARQGANPETPKMEGMRGLFRIERVAATPLYEGVGEMMSTPSGYREPEREEQADDDSEDEAMRDVIPALALPTRPKTAAGASRIPATRRTAPRAAKPTPTAERAVEVEDPAKVKRAVPSRTLRKPKSKTEDVQDDTVGATRSARARRGDPAMHDEQAADAAEGKSSDASSQPARRTRKPTPSEDIPPPTRSLRKTRAVKTPVPDEPTPAAAVKPSSSRRGTKTKPIEVDEDHDPLDSLARPTSPKKESAPSAADGAKVRRSGRGRLPTPNVKEEDPDDSPVPAAASEDAEGTTTTLRAGRSRKPASASKATTPATKSATRSRATSSAKIASGSSGSGAKNGKENTPERQTESPEDDQPEATGLEKPPATKSAGRTKVTRSAGKLRSVTEESVETKSDPKTRVSRTRR